MDDKEIKERLRFETLAAFVRDLAEYEVGDDTGDREAMREYVEQAQWLVSEIIEAGPADE